MIHPISFYQILLFIFDFLFFLLKSQYLSFFYFKSRSSIIFFVWFRVINLNLYIYPKHLWKSLDYCTPNIKKIQYESKYHQHTHKKKNHVHACICEKYTSTMTTKYPPPTKTKTAHVPTTPHHTTPQQNINTHKNIHKYYTHEHVMNNRSIENYVLVKCSKRKR